MNVANENYQYQDSYFVVIHPLTYVVLGIVGLLGVLFIIALKKRKKRL